ncbi:unnamed protein product [Tetraodon nigroviridis]|uniref:Chromosome 6 SCAF14737, whole genome shotgun sequence n=1 Tax=Tetraodon nigroviridis TaxID=99883 RepID=Q4S581_TETNG|nr:unnamed protein product [Tetraodon nigroviridis]
MRVKTKRAEAASAARPERVRSSGEGRCGPAATRVHLQDRPVARRQFLRLHRFSFAQHRRFPRRRCDDRRVSATKIPTSSNANPTRSSGITGPALLGRVRPRAPGSQHFDRPPPLSEWRNLPLQPLVISGLSPSLSTTFPRYYPPFFPFSPRTGAPVTGSWFINVYVF